MQQVTLGYKYAITHYNSRIKHHKADNTELYKQYKLHCGCSHTHKDKEKHSFTPYSRHTQRYIAREHSSCCRLHLPKCDSVSLVDNKVLRQSGAGSASLPDRSPFTPRSLYATLTQSSPTFRAFAVVTEIAKSVIDVANLNPRLHQDLELDALLPDADAPGASSPAAAADESCFFGFILTGVNHDFFMWLFFALLLMKPGMW